MLSALLLEQNMPKVTAPLKSRLPWWNPWLQSCAWKILIQYYTRATTLARDTICSSHFHSDPSLCFEHYTGIVHVSMLRCRYGSPNTHKVWDLHRVLSNECVFRMDVGCRQAGPDGNTVCGNFKTGVAWIWKKNKHWGCPSQLEAKCKYVRVSFSQKKALHRFPLTKFQTGGERERERQTPKTTWPLLWEEARDS